MKAAELLSEFEGMIARRRPALRTAVIAFVSAFAGVLMAGGLLVTVIDNRLDFLAMEGARLGSSLYLTHAYEVSGPGGLGRILVLPESDDAPIRLIDCPEWAGVENTCLSLVPHRQRD